MGLIKLIIKILVLPLVAAVTLIQWVGIDVYKRQGLYNIHL